MLLLELCGAGVVTAVFVDLMFCCCGVDSDYCFGWVFLNGWLLAYEF